MWEYAGVMKSKRSLIKCLEELEKVKSLLANINVSGPVEIKEFFEAKNMVKLGEIIATSSLKRCESRGCFWRIDYPTPDMKNWQRNIIVKKKGSSIEVETEPVVKVRDITFETPPIGAGCFPYDFGG